MEKKCFWEIVPLTDKEKKIEQNLMLFVFLSFWESAYLDFIMLACSYQLIHVRPTTLHLSPISQGKQLVLTASKDRATLNDIW